MDARLAVIATSIEDLRDKLSAWIALRSSGSDALESEHVFYGNLKETPFSAGSLIDGRTGQAYLRDLLANGELEKVARFWTLGAGIDWALLRRQGNPRKVSLPTYPFTRERCWVEQGVPSLAMAKPIAAPVAAPVRERSEEKQRTAYAVQWT